MRSVLPSWRPVTVLGRRLSPVTVKTGKITVQECAGANCAQPCHVNQTFNIGDCERGAKIVCSDDFPDIPEGDVMAYGYSTSANCNGDHDFVTTLSAGVCIETESGYLTAECSVDKQTVTLSSCQDSNCQTCASNTLPLGCFQLGGAGSINFQCSEGSSQDSESGLSSGAKAGIAILVLLLLLLTLTAILYFAFRNHPKVKPLLPGFLRPQGSSDIGTTTWGFEKGSTALDEGLLEDINETDVRS